MADSDEQQGQHQEPFPHALSEVCTRYEGAEESVQTEPTQHRPETDLTLRRTAIFNHFSETKIPRSKTRTARLCPFFYSTPSIALIIAV